MENLTTIQELQAEIANFKFAAKKAYDEYLAKGEALQHAAQEEENAFAVLVGRLQSATGTAGGKRGRGGVRGPRKAYNITPQSKVAAHTKRAETRARKAGKSDSEAKKIGREAGKALAQKLGI